jgi:hypothetical protein
MKHDESLDAATRRDQQVERYILALDRGDFEAVAEILAAAESDPELDRLLVDVDGALHAEAHLTTRAEDAQKVRTLLWKHLPSANLEAESGPITVGDVASRLQDQHAMGKQLLRGADVIANERLHGNRTPLTEKLNARYIKQLADSLDIEASPMYWESFRRAAVVLAMARDAGAVQLAAARQRRGRTSGHTTRLGDA